jgi:hypothetical protein
VPTQIRINQFLPRHTGTFEQASQTGIFRGYELECTKAAAARSNSTAAALFVASSVIRPAARHQALVVARCGLVVVVPTNSADFLFNPNVALTFHFLMGILILKCSFLFSWDQYNHVHSLQQQRKR